MKNRQTVRVNRPVGGFRQIVIHQSQKRSGQEKGNGIVSIPPLNNGILNTGIYRITFQQADRNFQRIKNMEHGNCNHRCNVKPDGNIQVFYPAFGNGTKQVDAINYPNNGNQYINRPFKLCIFLGSGITQRKGYGS